MMRKSDIQSQLKKYDDKKGIVKRILGDHSSIRALRYFYYSSLCLDGDKDRELTKADYRRLGLILSTEITAGKGHLSEEIFSDLIKKFGKFKYRLFMELYNLGLATEHISDLVEDIGNNCSAYIYYFSQNEIDLLSQVKQYATCIIEIFAEMNAAIDNNHLFNQKCFDLVCRLNQKILSSFIDHEESNLDVKSSTVNVSSKEFSATTINQIYKTVTNVFKHLNQAKILNQSNFDLILENPLYCQIIENSLDQIAKAGIFGQQLFNILWRNPQQSQNIANNVILSLNMLKASSLDTVKKNIDMILEFCEFYDLSRTLDVYHQEKMLTQATFDNIIRKLRRSQMESFCMGMHSRLGVKSTLFPFFGERHPIGDRNVFRLVKEFVNTRLG